MSSKRVPVRGTTKAWLEDPTFRAEYEALEKEFALASALIEARGQAGWHGPRWGRPFEISRPSSAT